MTKTPKDLLAEAIIAAYERNQRLYKARESGLTYEQVGQAFSISRQRAEQIHKRLKREKGETDG